MGPEIETDESATPQEQSATNIPFPNETATDVPVTEDKVVEIINQELYRRLGPVAEVLGPLLEPSIDTGITALEHRLRELEYRVFGEIKGWKL